MNWHRQAVVILGMHRSGTSAVAGTAVRLGVTPPLTPLAAADDNPGGFYESSPVVQQNYLMMKQAGCAWNVCLSLEPETLAQTVARELWPVLTDIVRQEYAAAAMFLLKDPRLCLTLPVWLPALRAERISPAVLIVCRHPVEVARSLAARNQSTEGDAVAHWLHHMLQAEQASRGMARAVIFYDDLLADWRRCMTEAGRAARIAWPHSFEQAGGEIDDFLAASLRHHRSERPSVSLGLPLVDDLSHAAWLAFRQLRDDPDSTIALACLDHVRERFCQWRRQIYPPGTVAIWPDA